MANYSTQRPSRQPRPSALGQDLVPAVSVDTGSAATAIAVRVGPAPLAASLVLNPETTAQRHAPGADPAVGYGKAVEDEVRRLAVEHSDVARAWYGTGAVPVGEDPWLYVVEKINPARRPETAAPGQRFDPVHVAEGSTFAANAVVNRLLGVLHGRVVWALPMHADTRWQASFEHGTGNPFDFYPAALLAGALPEGDTGVTFPDYYLDRDEFRASRVKDLCAAWSVGTDAAEDYERACVQMYGRLLPPHLAPNAVRRASPGPLNRDCGSPSVRRVDLGDLQDPAEVRYQYARARLAALGQGERQDAHVLARDLFVVAQYQGASVGEIVSTWTGWVTERIGADQPDLFLTPEQMETLRFVRRVQTVTHQLAA